MNRSTPNIRSPFFFFFFFILTAPFTFSLSFYQIEMETVGTENGDLSELQVIPAIGDCSCLFRSLSYLLFKEQHSHFSLRLLLVDFIASKWEYFQPRTIADREFLFKYCMVNFLVIPFTNFKFLSTVQLHIELLNTIPVI